MSISAAALLLLLAADSTAYLYLDELVLRYEKYFNISKPAPPTDEDLLERFGEIHRRIHEDRYIPSEDEVPENHDRIIVECEEDSMRIHVRMDFDKFHLKGDEPECQPQWSNITFPQWANSSFHDSIIRVKTWTLPLVEGSDGPCGLRYVSMDGAALWLHNVTLFGAGAGFKRDVQCLRAGALDNRGAHIRLRTLTPAFLNITAPLSTADTLYGEDAVGGTVGVLSGSTLTFAFHHHYPEATGVSLYPQRCWIVNERDNSRRLVLDKGCPLIEKSLHDFSNATVLTMSNEIYLWGKRRPEAYWNEYIHHFEHDDSSSIPPFRLQCDVFACKSMDLMRRVIGVPRCPLMQSCWDDNAEYRAMTRAAASQPKDTFEINLNFDISISSDQALESPKRRPIGIITRVTEQKVLEEQEEKKREEERKQEEEKLRQSDSSDSQRLIIGAVIVGVVCIVLALAVVLVVVVWYQRRLRRAEQLRGSGEAKFVLVARKIKPTRRSLPIRWRDPTFSAVENRQSYRVYLP